MSAPARPDLIDRLAGIVGRPHVLSDAAEVAPYFGDWRKQYAASAECVVRPASTAEVARVVELCVREGVAIVPQGGNTGLCGGSVPTGARREIVLSLSASAVRDRLRKKEEATHPRAEETPGTKQ